MGFAVDEILSWTGGRLVNAVEDLAKIRVERPSVLARSKSDDLAFFFSRNYEQDLPTAMPGVLITGEPFVKPLEAAGLPLWKRTAVIACKDPYLAMAILSEKFAAKLSTVTHSPTSGGKSNVSGIEIHPTAIVDATAELGAGVRVGPHCVIESHVRIGAGTVLYSGCYVGTRVSLGEDSVLFPGVTIYEGTQVGKRVRLHAGCVLGADGFGYAPKLENGKVTDHQKIYHLGHVVIGDDVEIGANSCVDRSTFGETRVDSKAKLDNLVHIGHNANVEHGAIICGGTCLGGNARVGRFAYVGGLTGIANHVHVGDGASVGALSLITKDVPSGGTAVGVPQREHKEHFRAHALLSRLLADRGKREGKRNQNE